MFKIETHLHTSESSPCAQIDATQMVRFYHEAGYKSVIITDHFMQKYLDEYDSKSWKNAVDRFFLGYRNAKAEGDKLGINVIMGVECHFEKFEGDYLLYGITPEIIYNFPNICQSTEEEFFPYMRENGVLVVQAHPYREGYGRTDPRNVDGYEAYNSNPRHKNFNEKAVATAKEYNLYVTAGSDAHRDNDYALSGMISNYEIKTIEDFVELVKSGKGRLIRDDISAE